MKNKQSFKKELQRKTKGVFFVALAASLSLTLMAFEWISYDVYVNKQDHLTAEVLDFENIKEIKVEIKKPKPTTPVKHKEYDPLKDKEPIIVKEAPKDLPPAEAKTDDKAKNEPIEEIITGDDGPKIIDLSNEFTTVAEIMPEYIGGIDKMYQYLGKNLKPNDCFTHTISNAKIYVRFIIEKDGEVTSVEFPREVGCGMDKMIKKVILGMPNWKPGKQGGKTVRVKYTLPIVFKS